jgi:hypothetical protein
MAKGPKDLNQTAFDLVARSTGNPTSDEIERAAKGGKARKEALTPERRSEIAKAAAAKRWGNGQPSQA